MIEAALMCLALNVYFEARSDTMTGQYAVAHVVINRVQHDKFPDDVCSVVKQSRNDGTCQFSWYCDGKSDNIRDISAWRTAKSIAGVLLSMPDMVPNIVEDATHYHAHYVKPHWADYLEQVVRIDGHIFYRETQ